MPACAAIKCTNRYSRGCGKTFHLFPVRHHARTQRWVVNMKRDKWMPSKRSVLCSDHFEESCFDKTGLTTRLRAHAEPTVFGFSVTLQKNKKKRKCPQIRHPPSQTTVSDQTPLKEGSSTPVVTTPVKSSNLSIIQREHSYFTSESPRSIKHKLDQACDKISNMKKQLKFTQQKARRLRKRVDSLEAIVKSLREQHLVCENGLELLVKDILWC